MRQRGLRSMAPLALVMAILGCLGGSVPQEAAEEILERRIEIRVLEDKIRGGWAGQMIGVSFGGPTEFRFMGEIIPEDKLPEWRPELVHGALEQDDLYVDMTFAQVLDDKGLDATTEDFGDMFRQSEYRLWHANLAARRALRRGVPATLSGTPEHNAHANDIDFQIEADFVGLMAPGLPQAGSELSVRAGRVMNHGDGILGGVFVNGMYAAAFFESDPRKIVEAGLATLPPASGYAAIISDTLAWSAENPGDWMAVWGRIQEKYDHGEACPAGALTPLNIDARINGAYIALGLLYGGGDFERTLEISTRAGQDSDCNPASAVGVLGVVLGYSGIPERYTSGIAEIAAQTFSYTEYSFESITASTLKRAVALVERNGGRLDAGALLVATQVPKPADVELWNDYGSPVERVPIDDPRWRFEGEWQESSSDWGKRGSFSTRASDIRGAQASISFVGSGAIITGNYLTGGGLADIYLDGDLHRTVDVYSDGQESKWFQAVWHAFGLESREHELRLVVRGEPYSSGGESSQGSEVALLDLVVFR